MKQTNNITQAITKWVLCLAMMVLSLNLASAQTTVTIGSGTTTSSFYPIYTCYGYNYSQQIYTAAELTAGGAIPGGQITQVKFFYNSGGTSFALWNNWNVYLGNTALNNFTGTTGWISTANLTSVFNGNIPTPVAGTWLTLTLTTPFTWTGGNLVVAVDENTPSYSCTAAWRSFTTTAAAGPRSILYYSDAVNPSPAAPPTANSSNTTTRAQLQLTMTGGAACSGTPNGGTASASVGSACASSPFSLSATGITSASGMSYQWQVSTNGGTTWSNITGATTSSASVTQSVASSYKLVSTCTNSGQSAHSNVVSVSQTPFLNCYCASNATSTADEDISNVSIGTLNNSSSCGVVAPGPGSIASQYSNFTTSVTAPSLMLGASYPASVTMTSCGGQYSNKSRMWIDFNQSGSFDAAELVLDGPLTSGNHTATGTVAIPANALVGLTRMRVVNVESSTVNACGTYTWGETEDYLVSIEAPAPMTFNFTNAQQQTVPAAASYGNVQILRVNVNTAGVVNPLNPSSLTFTTNGTTNTGFITNAKLYYTGANGATFSTTTQYGSSIANPNGTFIFTGSQNLLPGDNFFWLVYDVAAGVTGCNDVLDATYENVTFGITPAAPSNTDPAGNVAVYPTIVAKNFSPANGFSSNCKNVELSWAAQAPYAAWDLYIDGSLYASNITATTYTVALAGTHTWELTPVGVAPNGCQARTYTASNTLCYCIPPSTFGCTDFDVIGSVSIADQLSGAVLFSNTTFSACPGGTTGYSNYTSLTPANLMQGYTYNFTVQADFYSQGYAVWIDANDDGVFASSERVGFTNGTIPGSGQQNVLGAPFTFPIALNCGSPLGQHRMRVRSQYATSGANITPCGANSYGEVEDYVVNFIPGPTIVPVATNISGPATGICSPAGFNNPLNFAVGAGYVGAIQWEYSADNINWLTITNATSANQSLTANGPLNAFLRVKFTGQGCVPPTYSDPFNIVVSAPTVSLTSTGSSICRGASVTLSASGTVSGPYSWSNLANTQSITVSPLANTTYTVTIGSGLCTASASETVNIIGGPVATSALSPTVLTCPGTPVNLTSQLIPGLPGGTYVGSPISYAPLAITGSAGPSGDDVVSGAIPMPFNFSFYGNTYSNVYISTNGFMSFDAAPGSGCCSGQSLPNTSAPNNVIALAWEDLNAQAGGITYGTFGSAPNRVFVIDFNNVPHFGGSGGNITGQIQLFESTNVIEIHTGSMVSDGGNHTQGIENASGTIANAVPGRNAANWSGASDAYRFTPDPGVTFTYAGNVTYSWSGSNGFTANTQNAVDNPAATTTYTLTVADDLCSSTTTVTKNVHPAPSVFAFNGGPYCEGQNALFFGFGSSSAVSSGTCNYIFRLTDSFGDGWNGATMEVRQGATVVATLGSTFATGSSLDVPVALNGATGYSLFYTNGGIFPSEVGIQILDQNNTVIYTLNAGFGTVGSNLYQWTTGTCGSGPAPVTYAWTGPNGFTSTDQNPLVSGLSAANAGQYNVVITDANNCTASGIDFLTVNDNPDVDYTSFTLETCPGYSDGTMEIGISGGDGSYSISDGGLFSTFGSPAQFTGVPPGTYFFSISDGNLCGTTTSITVGTEANIPPVLVDCPANVSTTAASNACGAIVNFSLPSATDNCPVGLGNVIQTAGLAPGSLFPVGTTVNTFSVTDAEGATVTCSQTITVSDISAPVIANVPANISSCNPVSWTLPTITDNCAGVITTSSHVPGSVFPSGTTTVTYTATDVYGNTSSASFNVTVLEPSTAATSASSNRDFNNICLGENITLTVNGGSLGEQASWKWYRGTCGGAANYVGQGPSITVTPTVTTTYFVRAEGLCNSTACQSITVTVSSGGPASAPVFSTLPTAAAPGVNSTVCVNPVPGATFYQWFTQNGHNQSILFNGQVGPIQTSTNCVNVSFVLPQQNYFVRVFAGNACGRTSQTNAAGIRGTVSASTCINGPTQVCPGQTLSYTACAIPSQTSVSYNWQIIPAVPGTATISFNGTNATVNYLPGFTTAQICVNGISTFGLAGPSYCITVSTNAPTPGAITGLDTPCEGATQTYTIAPVANATSYTWSSSVAGAVVVGNGTSATVTFPANAFSGDVCVVANSSCGVSAPSCLAVTSGTPGIPGPISGPVSGICNASNVNYSLGTSDANSYNWIVPAGVTISGPSNLNAVNLNFGAGFTGGTITVEAFYDCGSATSSITVDGAPEAPSLTPAVICPEASELYTASATGATSYNWTLSGDDYSACTNPPTCSQYFVIWSVSGGSLSVTATNSCGTSPATAISGSSCRMSDEGFGTKVYPNPTDGTFFVEFRAQVAGDHNIYVTDISGRMVYSEVVDAQGGNITREIDLGASNAGLYMLYVKDPKGTISVTKVSVE